MLPITIVGVREGIRKETRIKEIQVHVCNMTILLNFHYLYSILHDMRHHIPVNYESNIIVFNFLSADWLKRFKNHARFKNDLRNAKEK